MAALVGLPVGVSLFGKQVLHDDRREGQQRSHSVIADAVHIGTRFDEFPHGGEIPFLAGPDQFWRVERHVPYRVIAECGN
jgi:hypothetical protein